MSYWVTLVILMAILGVSFYLIKKKYEDITSLAVIMSVMIGIMFMCHITDLPNAVKGGTTIEGRIKSVSSLTSLSIFCVASNETTDNVLYGNIAFVCNPKDIGEEKTYKITYLPITKQVVKIQESGGEI